MKTITIDSPITIKDIADLVTGNITETCLYSDQPNGACTASPTAHGFVEINRFIDKHGSLPINSFEVKIKPDGKTYRLDFHVDADATR